MNIVNWSGIDDEARARLLSRPAVGSSDAVRAGVGRILEQILADGDGALRALSRRFDGCELDSLEVDEAAFASAEVAVPMALKQAIGDARKRIEEFHRVTTAQDVSIETAPGVRCERTFRAIDNVGLYVPAGTAPLPSTVLMLAVPAGLAGCKNAIVCTPANSAGVCDATVLYTARLCGIRRVFKLGGAQAIAAMAFGTATVPRCDKLFGPGNSWVTEAKRQVAGMWDGPAIDMPAGPSEVLVIADDTANPAFVAADLLAQAEHGVDSQVILLSPSNELLAAVIAQLDLQLATLPRADIARSALQNSRFVLIADVATGVAISNRYAPEHLILNVLEPRMHLGAVANAGSVFLGGWSPEAVGDYCSGTNHVLPTHGYARAWSGVSVQSFTKSITVQELTQAGLQAIGPCAVALARAEGLLAHERSVSMRLTESESSR